jgi:hypothetical protein
MEGKPNNAVFIVWALFSVKMDLLSYHKPAAIVLGHSSDPLSFFGFKRSFHFGLEFEDARVLSE